MEYSIQQETHLVMLIQNNLNSIQIIINTEFDVSIDSIYPSHNPSSVDYLYGKTWSTVELSNNGNMTAENILLQLQIITMVKLSTQYAKSMVFVPNQQRNCIFDMLFEGESIIYSQHLILSIKIITMLIHWIIHY